MFKEMLIESIPVKKRLDDKYFRAKKIIERWDKIYTIMEGILERGIYNRTVPAQCAWAVMIMMKTGIRVGNETSAEGYLCVNAYANDFRKKVKTYGVTTLLIEHCYVEPSGDEEMLVLNFAGKKNVIQFFLIKDKILITGFRWLLGSKKPKDTLLDITHYDLTKFVKKHIGRKYSIKDIRTAKVNKVFIDIITKNDSTIVGLKLTKKSVANKAAMLAIAHTAEKIGHTKGVCKSRYVSPNLFTYYKEYLYELLEGNK